MDKKIIVLGIGNSILGDDGIGLKIVHDLSRDRDASPVDFEVTEEMGFSLLDYLTGYEQAIIIDSIQADGIPGTVHLFSIDDFKPNGALSNHFVGLPELVAMAHKINLGTFPSTIWLVGIDVCDPYLISSKLSRELLEKYPSVLKKIKKIINQLIQPKVLQL